MSRHSRGAPRRIAKPKNPFSATLRNPVFLGTAGIVLLTIAAYLPALGAGFVWDDDSMLTGNLFVKVPLGLYYIWCSTALPDYFPLTSTSFWLEWRLWGTNASGYHFTNILLHAASACLLWRVLKKLRIPGAWVAAIIFAVHPINVQSVAWITERKNTLCMFFFLLSSLWYLRSEDASIDNPPSPQISPRWYYWLSLLAFVFALLSKTAVVGMPFVLLGIAWWQRGKIGWQAIRRTMPFFAISLALGLITLWFQSHRSIGGDPIREADVLTRLAGAGWAVWFYLGKVLAPLNLSFVYPLWQIDSRSAMAWLPLAAVLILTVVLGLFRRSWGSPALLALGYFLLMLLPILGLVNIYFHRYSLVADHWAYFAVIGVIAAIVGGGTWLFKRHQSIVRWLLPAGAIAAVSWLASATWVQSRIYRDLGTLWEDTLAKNPGCWLAHNSLGSALASIGRSDEALRHFDRGLAVKPESVELLNNMASALLDLRRADEAIPWLSKAVAIAPSSAMAYYNLGNAHDQRGDVGQAQKFYRRAIELDPAHAEAHSNLGCLLFAAGKKQEAIDEFTAAISLKPGYAEALNNLAAIFLEKGRAQEAESLLRDALRSRPGYPDALFNLGNALHSQGRVKEAANAYESLLALTPNHPLAHCRLGTALRHAGDSPGAIAELKAALALQPDLAEAHHQLGVLLAGTRENSTALTHFRRAIELNPDWPEALTDLAFALGTAPVGEPRYGAEALQLAQRAVELTSRTNFAALDALAAALAQSGSLTEAARTAVAAAKLARAAGDTNRAAQIQSRQRLYEIGKQDR